MRRQPKIIRVTGEFKLYYMSKQKKRNPESKSRTEAEVGMNYDRPHWALVLPILFLIHLLGRVRGRGGGFLDFFPLDMLRLSCCKTCIGEQ